MIGFPLRLGEQRRGPGAAGRKLALRFKSAHFRIAIGLPELILAEFFTGREASQMFSCSWIGRSKEGLRLR